MGDGEGQSVLKKEEPFMVTITVPALIIRVRLWYAMDMPPMANNCLAVEHADGKAARTRLPTPIHKLAATSFCTPPKNAAVFVASRAPSGFLAPPCPAGSKQRSSASSLTSNPARPGSRRSHVHDPGTLSAVVVCAQQSQGGLGVDGPGPQDATSGGLCGWGSEPARRVNACERPFH